jgi:small GTP-binding protein
MEDKYIYKLIILGDTYVGKSSFISSYVAKNSDLTYNPTIGADFYTCLERDNSGRLIKCHIWDTAGQEKYRSITNGYMKNVTGAILMYDITNENSFSSLYYWINVLKEHTKLENLSMVVVGNKTDRKEHRCITREDGKNFALEYGAKYIETSVLQRENIDKIIPTIINLVSHKFFSDTNNNTNKFSKGIKVLSYEKESKIDDNSTNCCIIA